MRNFVNEARQILIECFEAEIPAVKLKEEAARQARLDIITNDYARQCAQSADNKIAAHHTRAMSELNRLRGEFAAECKKAATPDGNALGSPDYRLLAEGYPLTLEEFQSLCARNQGNSTVLRKAVEYGTPKGWGPYAKYKTPERRQAVYNELLKQASAILETAPGSPARSDAYWAMVSQKAVELCEL